MKKPIQSKYIFLTTLAVLIWLTLLLLNFAPIEKVLGSGIKVVYIHVALIITGKLGIILAGAIGILIMLRGSKKLHQFNKFLSHTSFAFFTFGIVMSVIAMKVNWGAFFWDEPRFKSATMILAIGVIVQVINSWLNNEKFQGFLQILLAVFLVWQIQTTQLIMHPVDPVGESDSTWIRVFFLAFTTLFCMAQGLIVSYLYRKSNLHSKWTQP